MFENTISIPTIPAKRIAMRVPTIEPRIFWMIIRGDGEGAAAVKRHYNYIEAMNEAERLCRKEGQPFYLLEAQRRVKQPVEWQTLLMKSEPPFVPSACLHGGD